MILNKLEQHVSRASPIAVQQDVRYHWTLSWIDPAFPTGRQARMPADLFFFASTVVFLESFRLHFTIYGLQIPAANVSLAEPG